MVDMPCLAELRSWIDLQKEYFAESKQIDDHLHDQWEAEDEASLVCPSTTFGLVDPETLPDTFLGLSDPPFNIPFPPGTAAEIADFHCLDLQITVRDERKEVDELWDLHRKTDAAIDEAFNGLMDCVRHPFGKDEEEGEEGEEEEESEPDQDRN
jgi:hypothetical protein